VRIEYKKNFMRDNLSHPAFYFVDNNCFEVCWMRINRRHRNNLFDKWTALVYTNGEHSFERWSAGKFQTQYSPRKEELEEYFELLK
jgi:hypothetical protein